MRRFSLEVFAPTLLIAAIGPPAAADYAMSSSPLAFGPDQTIVDLNKVDTWAPLELEGLYVLGVPPLDRRLLGMLLSR